MIFSLRFALRDTRRSRRKLALAGLAVMLGVGALVAVGSLGESLRRAVDEQSLSLVGADALVTSKAPFTPEADAKLKTLGGEIAQEVAMNSMLVLPQEKGGSQFVSIRAIDPAYPFYGDIKTEPSGAAAALADGKHVLIEDTVMARFALGPGDSVSLGGASFFVAGALKSIPGDSMSFASVSPRVILARSALAATGLSETGPLVRHRAYLKFPAGTNADAVMKAAAPELKALKLRYDTADNKSEQLGRTIDSIDDFLSLAGFVTLLLGSVGVAGAIRTHVREKMATIATLRCLGASSWNCFGAYLLQSAGLGALGAAAGVALGLAVRLGVPALLHGLLPVDIPVGISWAAAARGFGAGFTVCFLFTLPPLLAIRRVSPLAAIRAEYEPGERKFRIPEVSAHVLCVVAVFLFAYLQVGGLRRAAGFSGGLALMLLVMTGVSLLLMAIAKRLKLRAFPYVWRQGVANLHRPNNRTTLLLVTLGLGAGLLLTLGLARATVMSRIGDLGGASRPNLMLFDIQHDQLAPLRKTLARNRAAEIAEAPVVAMRLVSIRGRPIATGGFGEAWSAMTHEYRSTYRAKLSATETVVAGKFGGIAKPDAPEIPVSLETGVAKKLGVGLGDEIVFDVQGTPFATRVTSLREVEWRRFAPNFFVVFPTGVLEDAPQTHVMAVRADAATGVAGIQRELGAESPNISSIDLGSVLRTLDDIFAKVGVVVRFIALFTFGTGTIVLAGAMVASRGQRLRDAVLLRTLGASSAQVARILLVEYAMLGFLGALTGALLACFANEALAKFVFDAPAAYDLPLVLETVAGVTALAVITGLVTGRGATSRPPLEVLRAG